MNHSLSLVHSSRVAPAESDAQTPRIGVLRPRPAPPAATAKFTGAENRQFMSEAVKQAREYRWRIKYMFEPFPPLDTYPALTELIDVAQWHASQKPARRWLHTGPIRARETVMHDAEWFEFRGERWLWRLVENVDPLGLHLEVRSPIGRGMHRMVKCPWGAQ